MCGIAAYSLSPRSRVDRKLAAQALLAAIAERGADAVGYAYRRRNETYPTVVKQRTPASELLERVSVPDDATHLLVHVRDYTKGHPSIAANNHPVRHFSGCIDEFMLYSRPLSDREIADQYEQGRPTR